MHIWILGQISHNYIKELRKKCYLIHFQQKQAKKFPYTSTKKNAKAKKKKKNASRLGPPNWLTITETQDPTYASHLIQSYDYFPTPHTPLPPKTKKN